MTDEIALEQAAVELRAVLATVYRRMRQTKPLGELTPPQSAALSRLGHHGPMTAAELAKLERISPQSIAATLQGLIAQGLIERSADPVDGRRLILSLSDAGRATVDDRRAARTAQLSQALDALDPGERQALISALPALTRLAREL